MNFKKIKIILISTILALSISIYAMQIITARFTHAAIAAAANALIPKLFNRVSYLVKIILRGNSKQASEIIIRQEFSQTLKNAGNTSEGLPKNQHDQIKMCRDLHIILNQGDKNTDDVSSLINLYLQALEKNDGIVSKLSQDKNLANIDRLGTLSLAPNGIYSKGYSNEQELIAAKLKANIEALDKLTQLKINNLFAFSMIFFNIVKDINSACKLAIDLVKKQDSENKYIQDLCKNDKFLDIYKQATEYAYKLSLIASNNALPSYVRQTVMLQMNTINIEGAFGRSYNKLLSALNSYYFLPDGTFSSNGFSENTGRHIVDFISEISNNKDSYLTHLKNAADAGIIDAQNAYGNELKKPKFKPINKSFSSKASSKFLDYYFDNAKKAFNKITTFFSGRNIVTPNQVLNNPYNKDYLYLINTLSDDSLSHNHRISSADRILKKYQNHSRNTVGYDYYSPMHNVIGEYQNAFNQAARDLRDFINKCDLKQPELPIHRPRIITDPDSIQNRPCDLTPIEKPKDIGDPKTKSDEENKKICIPDKEKEIKVWECDYTKRQNLPGLKNPDPKVINNQNGPSEPNPDDRDSIARANQQEKQKQANENRKNQQEEKIEQEKRLTDANIIHEIEKLIKEEKEKINAAQKKAESDIADLSESERATKEAEIRAKLEEKINELRNETEREIRNLNLVKEVINHSEYTRLKSQALKNGMSIEAWEKGIKDECSLFDNPREIIDRLKSYNGLKIKTKDINGMRFKKLKFPIDHINRSQAKKNGRFSGFHFDENNAVRNDGKVKFSNIRRAPNGMYIATVTINGKTEEKTFFCNETNRTIHDLADAVLDRIAQENLSTIIPENGKYKLTLGFQGGELFAIVNATTGEIETCYPMHAAIQPTRR